jgi:hypothetical protein
MSFFEELGKKLAHHPSRNFDQRMAALMDREMGPRPAFSFRLPALRLLVPSAALAAMIAVYLVSGSTNQGPNAEMFHESPEFLTSIETLDSLEDESLINASDEEWAEVLAGVDT